MTTEKLSADVQTKTRAVLENLSRDEQQLLSRIVDAERNKLYMRNAYGIHDDIWRAIVETIR